MIDIQSRVRWKALTNKANDGEYEPNRRNSEPGLGFSHPAILTCTPADKLIATKAGNLLAQDRTDKQCEELETDLASFKVENLAEKLWYVDSLGEIVEFGAKTNHEC